MSPPSARAIDVVILGGGIAGLWTLNELTRGGWSCLLVEARALGAGQTLWSQGIIHGGLKYTLRGALSDAARAISAMPELWRACLSGAGAPDLSAAGVRAPHCYLWQTRSLRSRAGMIGARLGLRVAPEVLRPDERPAALRACPGTVARLGEPVIDPGAVLRVLAQAHAGRVVLSPPGGAALALDADNQGVIVGLGPERRVRARRAILAAGAGNAALREALGLAPGRTQVRPLHMVLLRGPASVLPELNGHCVDGARTRVTITSVLDASTRRVWQIGGEVAERGVSMSAPDLIAHARGELRDAIPGLDTAACEWSTYRADRAEGSTPAGQRPDDAVVIEEGPVLSVWPTKLALAPRLAALIAQRLPAPGGAALPLEAIDGLARPAVATAPWDEPRTWMPDDEASAPARA